MPLTKAASSDRTINVIHQKRLHEFWMDVMRRAISVLATVVTVMAAVRPPKKTRASVVRNEMMAFAMIVAQ